MATILELPFREDATIETYSDFDKLTTYFYEDETETTPTDFTGRVFSGEAIDPNTGAKLFDLTFNTPSNDGLIDPILTAAQTATLIGRRVDYWVKVGDDAYFFGCLTVSSAFKPGS